MTARFKGRLAKKLSLSDRDELLTLALRRLKPADLHLMQSESVDVDSCLGELVDLLADTLTCYEGSDEVAAGFHMLFRDWAGQGINPRICSQLLFAVCDVFRSLYEKEGYEGTEQVLALDEIFLELTQAAYEEALGSYEQALADWTAALQEVEHFPLDIAAMVDPLTLARSAVSRFFDLARARCVILAEVDQVGRLTPIAGTPAGRAMLRDFAPSLPESCLRPVLKDGIITRTTVGELHPAPDLAMHDTDEVLILPLRVRGRTTDVALLSQPLKGARFSEMTVHLARHFASRVGVALENSRLHAAAQRKIDETMGLLELARITSSTPHVRRMLKRAAEMLADLCRVPACAIWLRDEGSESYRAAAWSVEDMETRGKAVEEKDVPGLRRLARGETALLDLQQMRVFGEYEYLSERGISRAVLYPLAVRDSRLGFIIFYSDGQLDLEGLPALMETAAGQLAMALENASLYQDIEKNYFCTVKALAKAIEVKDPYTHGHSERVTRFAVALGETMKLEEQELRNLKYGATLHDIGKIGIEGRVLNKDGALDEEEYEHVKKHPVLGDSIIENVEFLQAPRRIILHHHERYDGKGYPAGLAGEEIPLEARILAVADAFEAMLSRRPYRMPRSLIEARKELQGNSGTQFDPRIVDIFLKMIDENPNLLEEDRRRRSEQPPRL